MSARTILGMLAVGAFVAPLLVTAEAAAQYPYPYAPPPPSDGPRFRGGVGLDVGGFIVPGGISFADGIIGVSGQLGVQINHNWAVYGVPELGILFGSATGLSGSAAVMGDYTFDGIPLSVGVGVETGDFVAIGTESVGTGAFYGARLHAAYYPVLVHGDLNPARRKALYIGLDLHIDGNSFGNGSVVCNGTACVGSSTGGVILSPVVAIGYQAF